MVAPLVAGALIGGGAQLLGNIFGAGQSRKMAREQMRFQERMRNTAHQAEVADLRAAGLNPLLSANTGASSPVGAMGEVPDYGETAARTTSSVLQASRMKAELALLGEQADSMKLDNLRKEAWMGVKLRAGPRVEGHGIEYGIPVESGFGSELSSARSAAAAAGYGLSERRAAASLWDNIGGAGKGGNMIIPWILKLLPLLLNK